MQMQTTYFGLHVMDVEDTVLQLMTTWNVYLPFSFQADNVTVAQGFSVSSSGDFMCKIHQKFQSKNQSTLLHAQLRQAMVTAQLGYLIGSLSLFRFTCT